MAGGSIGPATRGSRKCLQDYVENRSQELADLIVAHPFSTG